ncbi:Serine/threonine protein kinase [Handroanthus impetiginosus]|uniref:Serine/threonine protein kinase n=1 Tax=Handroanthus impetiginosus TaxID=429701 RepID=A0A2G9HSU6_9LAMI|nr:Serine/threonine protein kinase [Handroanthus impetiginosus]
MFKTNILVLLSFLNFANSQNWIRSGYVYAGSGYLLSGIDSTLFTHLVCAFAYINSSNYEIYIQPSDETFMASFTETVISKNPSAKTLLSIRAGKPDSSMFFDMTNSSMFFDMINSYSTFFGMINQSSHRASFIRSAMIAARRHGFMGLDLYDVFPSTSANKANMGSFFDEWREAINSEPRKYDTSPLILTMGAMYSPVMDSLIYPVNDIKRNFDWVHIRSFDYHVSSIDRFTGAHAALYDPSSNLNTDYGINEWIRQGLPAKKLLIGLPYHGFAWTLVNSNDHAIGAPAKGRAVTIDGSVSYKLIKWFLDSYKVKPVFNSLWIGFDDVEAIKTKVSYAKEKGLLGYNVFQMPNDDTHWILSTTAQGEENNQENKQQLWVIVLSTTLAAMILLSATICFLKRKSIIPKGKVVWSKRNKYTNQQGFTFTQIAAATDNFSSENKLGEGGFGPVYKGELQNGLQIAVKRLSKGSKQGKEELENELALTARLQHVNLVKVLGICTEREEQMLIYEYMPNGSLDNYLFDLKASNILLDKEMKPKISDFGIAKVFEKDENAASTRRIIGTYGYIPPEYVKGGVYSRKYDVYSFGVLLLQIISGKKTLSLFGLQKNLNLLEHAYELFKRDSSMDFMDPVLDDSSSTCKMKRCMQVALLCVQERWEDRPSMLEVSSMLKNEMENLPAPNMPAFSTCKRSEGEQICDLMEVCSAGMLTITQEMPR